MISDLSVSDGLVHKYMDDTTITDSYSDSESSVLQKCADELVSWSEKNHMNINATKTKELVISFSKSQDSSPDPVVINGKPIEWIAPSCLELQFSAI